MRYIRCEIDEITRAHFRGKFEPLSPAYLPATFHNIDSDLGTVVVMCSGLHIRWRATVPIQVSFPSVPAKSNAVRGLFKHGRVQDAARTTVTPPVCHLIVSVIVNFVMLASSR